MSSISALSLDRSSLFGPTESHFLFDAAIPSSTDILGHSDNLTNFAENTNNSFSSHMERRLLITRGLSLESSSDIEAITELALENTQTADEISQFLDSAKHMENSISVSLIHHFLRKASMHANPIN